MNNRKPNVVFVLTDDQGYGDLGCHGNPIVKTPYIDEFYAQSIRLTNYHVGPTCAPTRAGLMCGHYANSAGVWHTVGGRSLMRGNEVSIADVFRENGYVTGLFGKWHLGDNYPYRPQDRGFSEVITHGGGGISQAPDYWGNDYFDDTYLVNGKPKKYKGYCTDIWFNEAIKFIGSNKDKPFMCFVMPNAPHSPYNVEEKYSSLYKDKVKNIERAHFYGMITNLDYNFGYLIQKLKDIDIYNDTIIIFMTDNGSSCMDKEAHTCGFRGFKGSQYEGGHRVPFFIHWENGNLLSARDVNTLTSHVDFMPTLMDLCHIDLSRYYSLLNLHGRSLKPLLTQENYNWEERTIVTDSQRVPKPLKWRKCSIMTDKWRLIDGKELYDINSDIAQRHNIAMNYPEVVNQLRIEYDKWWNLVSKQYKDEIPITIGSDQEQITCLCAHDWRDKHHFYNEDSDIKENNEYLVWSQEQVRKGLGKKGYWEIDIAKKGMYEFELRRWPKEENRAITEGILESKNGWRSDIILDKYKDWYSGGKSLSFKKAFVKLGDVFIERDINEKDKKVCFEIKLKKGPIHLEAWFSDGKSLERGAYYVYVTKK